MKRKSVNRVLLLLLLMSLLAGCATKKNRVAFSPVAVESAELVASSPAATLVHDGLSGSTRLSANIGGKQFSSSGTLRIRKGEGIQIGITPLGLVEVACIEFFPAEARFIYKIGKEYACVPYSAVPFLKQSGIDYSMLESIFMNRLFLPGDISIEKFLAGAEYSVDGSLVVATYKADGITYSFAFEKESRNLVSSRGKHSSGIEVVCNYSDFEQLDGTSFPRKMVLEVNGIAKPVSLSFVSSNLKAGKVSFSPRKISSSYDKLEIEEVIKSLGNL